MPPPSPPPVTSALRLRAAWLVPVAGPPVRDGAILIGEDGRIVAAGSHPAVPEPPGVRSERFEQGALLPGLINTHTHLELTGLVGAGLIPPDRFIPPDDFPAWIRRLRELKAERTPADWLAAAREGLRRCHAAGITTIADTGDSGAVIRALDETGAGGIAYQEVFGPNPLQLEDSVRRLLERVEELQRHAVGRVRLGVSPHAPYTVSGPLYRVVADYARRAGLPIAVHVAESRAETELIVRARGSFADAWQARRIPLTTHPTHEAPVGGARSPVAWLDWFGVLGPRTLAIHAVQVDEPDVAVLRARGVAVAHCPRSNQRHGHGDAPLRAMLDAGIAVGVGTDSELSVGDLDLFAEARTARALAGLSAPETLGLMTRSAARAIGMTGEVGELTVGGWGDVLALDLGEVTAAGQVEEVVLAAGPASVRGTWIGGRQVHRRS